MKRYISHMSQTAGLIAKIGEELAKGHGAVPVIVGKSVKTFEQLGYLHSTVLPIFTRVMYEAGEIQHNTERYGKYHLKVLINYGEWLNYKGGKVFDDDSFSEADTEVLSKAIDKAIWECEQRGEYVPPPRSKSA